MEQEKDDFTTLRIHQKKAKNNSKVEEKRRKNSNDLTKQHRQITKEQRRFLAAKKQKGRGSHFIHHLQPVRQKTFHRRRSCPQKEDVQKMAVSVF
jgi:DUF4097 and DUF4098 domain-containing protein YvlB